MYNVNGFSCFTCLARVKVISTNCVLSMLTSKMYLILDKTKEYTDMENLKTTYTKRCKDDTVSIIQLSKDPCP